MLKRVLSALLLIPAVLAFVVYAPPRLFAAGLAVAGTFCLYEYFQMVRAMGLVPRPFFGSAMFWLLMASFQQVWVPAPAAAAGVLIAVFLAALWRRDPLRDNVLSLMATVLGVFYVALCLYPAVQVRYEFGDAVGMQWILVLLAVLWAGDTAALLVGRSLGRTPFAPRISPKKTNEGAVGGLVAGVVAALLVQHFAFPGLPIVHVVAVSVLLGIFGQLGDLAESMLKRAAQIKDSSHLIPGHGGVLDRVDSLLFAFPVLYIYLHVLYSR
jgi:phosphatidate cytidylyltransferase